MIDRAEVEALLACVEQVHKPNKGVIAELCRVYLAWLDAPVVDVTDCNNPKRQLPNDPFGITWGDFPTIKCRIVPERLVTDAEGK